jgi:mRNA-degrading endonuclease toxin of MazEF toxin-antitoxin module
MFKPWEIWWANVKFEDTDEYKRRPVLIISANANSCTAYKLTSQSERIGEYALRDWEKSGLPKPSVVRVKHIVFLESRDLYQKIGPVSLFDRNNIEILVCENT